MRKLPVLLLLAAACDSSGGAPPAPPAPPSKPEPAQITVRHILIAFKGAKRSTVTRSRDEAKALAGQLLEIAKKGEDFAALMRAHSDDPGPGVYTMANDGQPASQPPVYPRRGMAPAFGNVGFKLEVKGIGMAEHDPTISPFGWHIIQRVE